MPLQKFYYLCTFVFLASCLPKGNLEKENNNVSRERISINEGWLFMKYNSDPDSLIYDARPEVTDRNDNKVADSKPTEATIIESKQTVLKDWILPSGNAFINDPVKHHLRPDGDPGNDFAFVQSNLMTMDGKK